MVGTAESVSLREMSLNIWCVTRKTYLFTQTHRVGFSKVATRQYTDAHAAMRFVSTAMPRSSAWQCADAPQIYTMRKKSADEQASVRTQYWLSSKFLCLHMFVGANVQVDVSGYLTPLMKEVCC